MKCPKCGYLGFEPVDRCRNCGYDFSLTPPPPLAELSMRPAVPENDGPLDDLTLAEPPGRAASVDTLREPAGGARTPAARRGVITPSELPLFGSAPVDDAPLITKISPPRQPLAVRRATPEVPRLRAEARSMPLDQALPDLGEPAAATVRVQAPIDAAARTESGPRQQDADVAGIPSRTIAAVIDLLVVLAIDLVVVYFTLQISGLAFEELAILPKAPLAAFLLLLASGYFIVFTVGGQTLGQMTTGVRVVADGSMHPPDIGRAIIRTFTWFLLLIPAGLGLFSVMFDEDRRGLHDRVAGTRVVRATT